MNHVKNIIISALLLISCQASAVEYNQVQLNQSTVTFGYRQMGVPMEGKFGKFSAQVGFDPDKLANAHAQIDVVLASIDTGSSEADEGVTGKLWFNTQVYPLASFVSTGVRLLGGNRYQATGKLTIKGKTLDVAAPVSLTVNGNRAAFDGSFNIKRLSYGVGIGEWTDLDTVADDIQIKFHLVVLASPSSNPQQRKTP
jgi:polyisoprenoid-binding protein YceI